MHVCIVPMAQRTVDAPAEADDASGPCNNWELPRIESTITAASPTGATMKRSDVHGNTVLGPSPATSMTGIIEAIQVVYTRVTYGANG